MRYNDIITERELQEGPLDWIKQKAGQAADYAADKLGYQPKQKPAQTKVNKAAAADFDFDANLKNQPQVKPIDMTGVKTSSNAADFDFDAKPDYSKVKRVNVDFPSSKSGPEKVSGGGFQGQRIASVGGKQVTGRAADQVQSRLNKAIDNDFQMRRDALAARSTDRKDIQAYRQKQAKANTQAINKMAKDPNSQWNQKINIDDL